MQAEALKKMVLDINCMKTETQNIELKSSEREYEMIFVQWIMRK